MNYIIGKYSTWERICKKTDRHFNDGPDVEFANVGYSAAAGAGSSTMTL